MTGAYRSRWPGPARGAVSLCVGAVLLGGCGGDAWGYPQQWSPSTEVVAGTTVVRTPPVDDRTIATEVEELLRIGVVEGPPEYQFAYPTHVVVGEDEAVYVWDDQLKALRKYDAGGRFVRDIGAIGEGPGEFSMVEGLVIAGGHLVLWDAGNGRLNVYDTAGVFTTSWRVPPTPGNLATGLAADADGGVYVSQQVPEGDAFVKVRLTDGADVDTVLAPALEPGERLRAVSPGGLMVQVAIPFGPERFLAFHPAGFFVGAVGERYAVTLFRDDAAPLRIEREVNPTPISGAKRRQLRGQVTDVMRMADPQWEWDGPAIPDERPYLVGLMVGADGSIWVRRSVASEASVYADAIDELGDLLRTGTEKPETFDVFDPDGRLRGQVILPANATALYVSSTTVWARVLGELDVPYIVKFALRS